MRNISLFGFAFVKLKKNPEEIVKTVSQVRGTKEKKVNDEANFFFFKSFYLIIESGHTLNSFILFFS